MTLILLDLLMSIAFSFLAITVILSFYENRAKKAILLIMSDGRPRDIYSLVCEARLKSFRGLAYVVPSAASELLKHGFLEASVITISRGNLATRDEITEHFMVLVFRLSQSKPPPPPPRKRERLKAGWWRPFAPPSPVTP